VKVHSPFRAAMTDYSPPPGCANLRRLIGIDDQTDTRPRQASRIGPHGPDCVEPRAGFDDRTPPHARPTGNLAVL